MKKCNALLLALCVLSALPLLLCPAWAYATAFSMAEAYLYPQSIQVDVDDGLVVEWTNAEAESGGFVQNLSESDNDDDYNDVSPYTTYAEVVTFDNATFRAGTNYELNYIAEETSAWADSSYLFGSASAGAYVTGWYNVLDGAGDVTITIDYYLYGYVSGDVAGDYATAASQAYIWSNVFNGETWDFKQDTDGKDTSVSGNGMDLYEIYDVQLELSFYLEEGYNGVVYAGVWNESQATAVPEPATMLLLGTGLVGLGVFGRKKFKKA